jgi:RimJ/RimL family protein N-acetyltransferase
MNVEPAPTPVLPQVAGYEARLLDAGAAAPVQALFERCNDFFQLINGRPVPTDEAASFFALELPWERTIVGFLRAGEEELIGLVELVKGAPTPDDFCIGLLVVDARERGAGFGTRAVAAVAAWAIARQGRRLTLVVQHVNTRARAFWARLGFEPYAEVEGAAKVAASVERVAALAAARLR